MPPKYNYQASNDRFFRIPEEPGLLPLNNEEYEKGYEQLAECLFERVGLYVNDQTERERLFYFEDDQPKSVTKEMVNTEEGRRQLVDLAAANRLFAFPLQKAVPYQVALDKNEKGELRFHTKEFHESSTNDLDDYEPDELDIQMPRKTAEILSKEKPQITVWMYIVNFFTGKHQSLIDEKKAYEKAEKEAAEYQTPAKAKDAYDKRYREAAFTLGLKLGLKSSSRLRQLDIPAKEEAKAAETKRLREEKEKQLPLEKQEARRKQREKFEQSQKEARPLYDYLVQNAKTDPTKTKKEREKQAKKEANEKIKPYLAMKPTPLNVHTHLAQGTKEEALHHIEVIKQKEQDDRVRLSQQLAKKKEELLQAKENPEAGQKEMSTEEKVFACAALHTSDDPAKMKEEIVSLLDDAMQKNPSTNAGTVSMKAAVMLYENFPEDKRGEQLSGLKPYIQGLKKLDSLLTDGRQAEQKLRDAAEGNKITNGYERDSTISKLAVSRSLRDRLHLYTDAQKENPGDLPKAMTDENSFLAELCSGMSADGLRKTIENTLDIGALRKLSDADVLSELNKPSNLKKYEKDLNAGKTEAGKQKEAEKTREFTTQETTYERDILDPKKTLEQLKSGEKKMSDL